MNILDASCRSTGPSNTLTSCITYLATTEPRRLPTCLRWVCLFLVALGGSPSCLRPFHPGTHGYHGMFFFALVQENKTLRTLKLLSNGIGPKGAAALGKGLLVCWWHRVRAFGRVRVRGAFWCAMRLFTLYDLQHNTGVLRLIGVGHTEDTKQALKVQRVAPFFISDLWMIELTLFSPQQRNQLRSITENIAGDNPKLTRLVWRGCGLDSEVVLALGEALKVGAKKKRRRACVAFLLLVCW